MSQRPNEIHVMKKKTHFDLYLEQQLKDPVFAERFEEAGEVWDAEIQATSICKP